MEATELTTEQIAKKADDERDAKFKALGAVVCIDIEKEGKRYLAYLKTPDRYAVGVFLATVESSVTTACEHIYTSAIIKDDETDYKAIIEDDLLFISACPAIQRCVPFKKNNSRIL